MRQIRFLLFALCLLVLPLGAQTPTGTISGVVTDSTGSSIAAAAVNITETSTNVSRSVVTDSQGRYNVPFVLPGSYVVKIVATGFRPASQTGVEVRVANTSSADFALSVGNVTEQVQVSADTQRKSSNLSATIGTREILDLPDNGRNPFDFASLAPAVSNVGNASTPHIGGSRNGNNEQLIDGMTNILPENNVGNNLSAYTASILATASSSPSSSRFAIPTRCSGTSARSTSFPRA